MATTTNYGWTTPDDTALVKDGASAIRTLGSSVDTTTKNLNPETTLGDLAYRSSTANVKTRLALGTAGQVLTVNSGATAPEWANAPTWTTFTPTFNNLTVGNGTLTAKYLNLNKTLIFRVQLVFGSTTSMGSSASLNLPVTAQSTAAAQSGIYTINFQDHGVGTVIGVVQSLNISSTAVNFGGSLAVGGYTAYEATSSTKPFTWNTNDQIYIGGMYEVA